MSRVTHLFNRITSTNITAQSDGRASISDEEAAVAGSSLAKDEFGPAAERSAMISRLLATPESFATTAAYNTFLRAARPSQFDPSPLARSVSVRGTDGEYSIRAVLDGKTVEIGTSETLGSRPQAIVAGGGRYVLWSTDGHVGGDEGEGEGVMCYDACSGITTRIADFYAPIYGLKEVVGPAGTVYILAQFDFDAEGSATAVIDPTRGELAYVDGSFVRRSGEGLVFRGEGTEGNPLPPETITFRDLADAAVTVREPDVSGDADLRPADVLAAYDAGSASVQETTDNEAVWDVFERLRAETERFSIATAYEESAATTLYTMQVTNEYGHTHTAFAVRQDLGEETVVTFLDERGHVIARR